MNTKRGDAPDWVQVGDNNLHSAIDRWQTEASRLAAENESLRAELEATENLAIKQGEWLQSIANITKGEPGELAQHSTHDVVESVEHLKMAAEAEAHALDKANRELKALRANRLTEKSREHFVAQLKAQGAREALQAVRYNQGFSDTVVRVDELQKVIADMEKQV